MSSVPPPPDDSVSPQEAADLDSALADLAVGIEGWAALPLANRAALLRATKRSVSRNAQQWTQAAVIAKAVPPGPLEGEEWISGPYAMLSNLDVLIQSLDALAAGRSPLAGVKTGAAPGGRTTLRVLPADLKDAALLSGFSAEVWLPSGVGADQARLSAGLGQRTPNRNGGVGVVLGAGNISAIGPLDVLYELIAANRASVLKLNPTFAGLKVAYEASLRPLIDADLLRIVLGAAATGSYLVSHPDISHVHITGAAATHDAIVWGVGAEAARRRGTHEPKLTAEITSELGGISPIIIVPGTWSDAEIQFQAEHVATQRLHNVGHNCIAGQALVLSAGWPQREQFLATLAEVLRTLPTREPWYPGSDKKIAAALTSYPDATTLGGRYLVEVTEQSSQDLLSTEYFAPVLGHTTVPGVGAEFLTNAVAFANDRLDGTLGASIIVKPRDRKAMGAAFHEAIAELRYGTIGINAWSAFGFLQASVPWGAYPGHTLADVGSGIGIVHNSRLIDSSEKTIVTGPFRPFPASIRHGELAFSPRPPWFVTAKTADKTGRLLTKFAAKRTWLNLARVAISAFRG